MMISSINRKHALPCREGFTLLEIMVVVSIIIMLASMVIGVGMYVQGLVQIKQTENIISALSLAAHTYASDYAGKFPPSHDRPGGAPNDCTGTNGAGIQALCSRIFLNEAYSDSLTGVKNLTKPTSYVKAKDFKNKVVVFKTSEKDEVDYIVDAWGVPLFYYRPGAPFRNSSSFDLFSAGPDSRSSDKIWSPTGDVFKYSEAKSYVYDSGLRAMVVVPPTADPSVISSLVVVEDSDDTACKEAVMDDIGNFKYVKPTE